MANIIRRSFWILAATFSTFLMVLETAISSAGLADRCVRSCAVLIVKVKGLPVLGFRLSDRLRRYFSWIY